MHGMNVKIKRLCKKDLEKFADIMSYLNICIQSKKQFPDQLCTIVQCVYSAMVWETNANWQQKKW